MRLCIEVHYLWTPRVEEDLHKNVACGKGLQCCRSCRRRQDLSLKANPTHSIMLCFYEKAPDTLSFDQRSSGQFRLEVWGSAMLTGLWRFLGPIWLDGSVPQLRLSISTRIPPSQRPKPKDPSLWCTPA